MKQEHYPGEKTNGTSPYFLLVPISEDPNQHEILGPYSKDIAETLQEEFGGIIVIEEVDVKQS